MPEDAGTEQTNEQDQPVEQPEGGEASSSFSASDLARAESLGLSREEIESIGPQYLPTVLRAADRVAAGAMGGMSAGQAGVGAPPAGGQPITGAGQVDPMQFAAKVELNTDEIDEGLAKAIQSINEHYANHSVQMMMAIGELLNRLQGVNDTVDRMTFESHLSSLGEDWHSVFGPPNKRNDREVQRLRDQVRTMQQLAAANGQQLPYGEAFQRALGSLYLTRLAELERSKLNRKVQRATNRVSERPKSREEEPATGGRESAIERIRKAKLADMGAG